MKKSILSVAFLAALAFASCGDKDKSCKADDIKDAVTKVTEAATAYALDPTNSQKCKDYKSSVDDYVETVDGCPDVSQADIDAIKDGVKNLTCP